MLEDWLEVTDFNMPPSEMSIEEAELVNELVEEYTQE